MTTTTNESLKKGREALEIGDYPAALRHLRAAVAAEPGVETYALLGEACAESGQLRDAITALQRARELEPANSDVLLLSAMPFSRIINRRRRWRPIRRSLSAIRTRPMPG